MSETITIGERTINLAKCFPITIGNWEDLADAGLINEANELQATGAKQMIDVCHIILRNAAPDLDRNEVRSIGIHDLQTVMSRMMGAMAASEEGEGDKPQLQGDPS